MVESMGERPEDAAPSQVAKETAGTGEKSALVFPALPFHALPSHVYLPLLGLTARCLGFMTQ